MAIAAEMMENKVAEGNYCVGYPVTFGELVTASNIAGWLLLTVGSVRSPLPCPSGAVIGIFTLIAICIKVYLSLNVAF